MLLQRFKLGIVLNNHQRLVLLLLFKNNKHKFIDLLVL